MPPFLNVFLIPVRDNLAAQVLILSLLILSFLDILAGTLNAWFIQHDYKSATLRTGVIKKLVNLIVVLAAVAIDAIMLTGIDMAWLPVGIPEGSVVVVVCTAFVAMEVSSLLEIYAESHPEVADSKWWQMLASAKGEGLDPDATLDLGRHLNGGE